MPPSPQPNRQRPWWVEQRTFVVPTTLQAHIQNLPEQIQIFFCFIVSKVVIETKNYAANVKCDGDQWFVNGKRTKSLSRQAKSNAVAVRQSLESIFAKHRTRLPYVEPIVVFVKHKHRLELSQPTVQVLKAEELVNFICEYERRSRFDRFTPELRRAIGDHFQLLQNPNGLRGGLAAPIENRAL